MNIQTAEELSAKKCQPCEGGVDSCSLEQATRQLASLKDWHLSADGNRISRKYALKNFADAVALINRVAALAESDQHHPDLHLTGYRNLRIDLTTHAIGGLSENDFILAAKIDAISKSN